MAKEKKAATEEIANREAALAQGNKPVTPPSWDSLPLEMKVERLRQVALHKDPHDANLA